MGRDVPDRPGTVRQVAPALRDEVGPGGWNIHSPRVPSVAEIAEQLRAAATVFPADRLWANPDCGLKTRDSSREHAASSIRPASALATNVHRLREPPPPAWLRCLRRP